MGGGRGGGGGGGGEASKSTDGLPGLIVLPHLRGGLKSGT